MSIKPSDPLNTVTAGGNSAAVKATLPPASAPIDASTDGLSEPERKARKYEETRRAIENNNTSGINFLAFLLMALFGFKNSDPDNNSTKSFAEALAIDSKKFKNTLSDIKEGKTTIAGAALSILTDIDPAKVNIDKARRAAARPSIGSIGTIEISERQKAIVDAIPRAAAAAGISADFMKGLWGVESTFGKKLVSPTGCEGDWQFSQDTWDGQMRKHGATIAGLISDPAKTADILANYKTKGALDKYQYDPEVSTFMSAFLNKDNAKIMRINPLDKSSWGLLYAAYNVGAGNAKELKAMEELGSNANAMAKLGQVAAYNPMFYKGGATGGEALDRYQGVIEARLKDYNKHLAKLETPTTLLAQADTPQRLRLPFKPEGTDQTGKPPASAGEAFTLAGITGGTNEILKASATRPLFNLQNASPSVVKPT